MAMRDAILPEFDHEMANTRRTLERVPEDKFTWRPHEKSFTMQFLASHVANLPSWTDVTINQDSIDVGSDGGDFKTPQASNTKELVEWFDQNVAKAREILANVSDETLMQPWSLLQDGKTVLTMPRIAVLRGFIMSHGIHHRAQLTVYLRLNGVPVPALYGPSADESM